MCIYEKAMIVKLNVKRWTGTRQDIGQKAKEIAEKMAAYMGEQ